MGVGGEPTELAGIAEAQTESAYAWALEEEPADWPRRRLTPTHVTILALLGCLMLIGAAGGVVWWHLNQEDPPTASEPLIKPATPIVVPPSTITITAPPPKTTADFDREFVATLEQRGWTIVNPANITQNAHRVCELLREGETPRSVGQAILAAGGVFSAMEAESFVATSMQTYPNCP